MKNKRLVVLSLCVAVCSLLAGISYAHHVAARVTTITQEQQKIITQTVATFAPQVDELYISPNHDGGVSINATATLSDYKLSYVLASDVADRFLYGVYRDLPFIHVDFAGLYIRYEGRYVMAVGLGRQAMQNLSVRVFAPDRGIAVIKAIQGMNDTSSALIDQAYAQYQAP